MTFYCQLCTVLRVTSSCVAELYDVCGALITVCYQHQEKFLSVQTCSTVHTVQSLHTDDPPGYENSVTLSRSPVTRILIWVPNHRGNS